MPVSYHVYANDGRGGAVDYSTPIATTAALAYAAGPLAAPSDTTFAVRAFDAASGIEEANTDARVRIIVDADGNDATARPNAPLGLSATPMAGGALLVAWSYDPTGQGGPPSRFDLSLSARGAAEPAWPTASVGYQPGRAGHGCTLAALPGVATATLAVRAVGTAPWLVGPSATVAVRCPIVALSDVDALVATATP